MSQVVIIGGKKVIIVGYGSAGLAAAIESLQSNPPVSENVKLVEREQIKSLSLVLNQMYDLEYTLPEGGRSERNKRRGTKPKNNTNFKKLGRWKGYP